MMEPKYSKKKVTKRSSPCRTTSCQRSDSSAAKLSASAKFSAAPSLHIAVGSLAWSSVMCTVRKSPSAACTRAQSAETGEATSRVMTAEARK